MATAKTLSSGIQLTYLFRKLNISSHSCSFKFASLSNIPPHVLYGDGDGTAIVRAQESKPPDGFLRMRKTHPAFSGLQISTSPLAFPSLPFLQFPYHLFAFLPLLRPGMPTARSPSSHNTDASDNNIDKHPASSITDEDSKHVGI